MKPFKYSLVAIIDGQEFRRNNLTRSEFEKLVEMIYSKGGWLVEYTEEEVL